MFCLNNAVYQDQNSGALFDQICLVTTDKTVFFYEAVPIATSQTFKFEEMKPVSDKGGMPCGGSTPL